MTTTCTHCILDDRDDPKISFDNKGVCNHCHKYEDDKRFFVIEGEMGKSTWAAMVDKMRGYGRKKKYDCILGLSGGVDSSYMAYLAKKAGLRVLCVHMDNGWNSKEASANIMNIVSKLKFDLHTVVINWNEMRDLQRAYLKSGVLDLDVPADHAIIAVGHLVAMKFRIKYMLSGFNVATESVLPENFNYDKSDSLNMLDIHRKYGDIKLKSFPVFGQKQKLLASYFYQLQSIRPLNWLDYDKRSAIEILKKELNWEPYGQKHFENIFTRFYQGFILPQRFHIDKRKAHLSNLICSGQLSRQQALEDLAMPIYDHEQLRSDKDYFLSKLGITIDEFNWYMTQPIRQHSEFAVEKPLSRFLPGRKLLKKFFSRK